MVDPAQNKKIVTASQLESEEGSLSVFVSRLYIVTFKNERLFLFSLRKNNIILFCCGAGPRAGVRPRSGAAEPFRRAGQVRARTERQGCTGRLCGLGVPRQRGGRG